MDDGKRLSPPHQVAHGQLRDEFAPLLRFIVGNKLVENAKVAPCTEPLPQKCFVCGHFRGDQEKIVKRTIGTKTIAASTSFSGNLSWVPLAPFGVNLSPLLVNQQSTSFCPVDQAAPKSSPPASPARFGQASYLALCGLPGEEYSCRRHFELGFMFIAARGVASRSDAGFLYTAQIHTHADELVFTVQRELNVLELLAHRVWSSVTMSRSLSKKEVAELLEKCSGFGFASSLGVAQQVASQLPSSSTTTRDSPDVSSSSSFSSADVRDSPWHPYALPLAQGRRAANGAAAAVAIAAKGCTFAAGPSTSRLVSLGSDAPATVSGLQTAIREAVRVPNSNVECNAFSCVLGQARVAEGGHHQLEMCGFDPFVSKAHFDAFAANVKPFGTRDRLEALLRTRAGDMVRAVSYFMESPPRFERFVLRADCQHDLHFAGFAFQDVSHLIDSAVSVSLGVIYCSLVQSDIAALSREPWPKILSWSLLSCPFLEVVEARWISTSLGTIEESGKSNVVFLDKVKSCTWSTPVPAKSDAGEIGEQDEEECGDDASGSFAERPKVFVQFSPEMYAISTAHDAAESLYPSSGLQQLPQLNFHKQAQKKGGILARFLMTIDAPVQSKAVRDSPDACSTSVDSVVAALPSAVTSKGGRAFILLPATDQAVVLSVPQGRLTHRRSAWTKPVLPAHALARNAAFLNTLLDEAQRAALACSCPIGSLFLFCRSGTCLIQNVKPLRLASFQLKNQPANESPQYVPPVPAVDEKVPVQSLFAYVTVGTDFMDYFHIFQYFRPCPDVERSRGKDDRLKQSLQHVQSWRFPKAGAMPVYLLDPRAVIDTAILFGQEVLEVSSEVTRFVENALGSPGKLSTSSLNVAGEGKGKVAIVKIGRAASYSGEATAFAEKWLENRVSLAAPHPAGACKTATVTSQALALAAEQGLREHYAASCDTSVGRQVSLNNIPAGIAKLASSVNPNCAFSLRITLLRVPSSKHLVQDAHILSELLRHSLGTKCGRIGDSSSSSQQGFAVRAEFGSITEKSVTEFSTFTSSVATKTSATCYTSDLSTPGGAVCRVEAETFVAGTYNPSPPSPTRSSMFDGGIDEAVADATMLQAHGNVSSAVSRYLALYRFDLGSLRQHAETVTTLCRWRCPYKHFSSPDSDNSEKGATRNDSIFLDIDETYLLKISDKARQNRHQQEGTNRKASPREERSLPASGPNVDISLTFSSLKRAGDVSADAVERIVCSGLQALDELLWLASDLPTNTTNSKPVAAPGTTRIISDAAEGLVLRPLEQAEVDDDSPCQLLTEQQQQQQIQKQQRPAESKPITTAVPRRPEGPLLMFLLAAVHDVFGGEAPTEQRRQAEADMYKVIDAQRDAIRHVPLTALSDPERVVNLLVEMFPQHLGLPPALSSESSVGLMILLRLRQLLEYFRLNPYFLRSESVSCAWIQLPFQLCSTSSAIPGGLVVPAGSPILFGHLIPGQSERDARKFIQSMKSVAAGSDLLRKVKWKHSLLFPTAASFALVPRDEGSSIAGGLELDDCTSNLNAGVVSTSMQPYASDMLSIVVDRPVAQGDDAHCALIHNQSQASRFQVGGPLVTVGVGGAGGKFVGFGTKLRGTSLRVSLPRLALRSILTVL